MLISILIIIDLLMLVYLLTLTNMFMQILLNLLLLNNLQDTLYQINNKVMDPIMLIIISNQIMIEVELKLKC